MVPLVRCDEIAREWGLSPRSVRNYCASGRIAGALLIGKTWWIPEDAGRPERKERIHKLPENVGKRLRIEMERGLRGGLYHRMQVDLTYNSNHIEGSRLTRDQTKWIFETSTLGELAQDVPMDDVIETANHFRCVDEVIKTYGVRITEPYVKRLHFILKNGTTDSRKPYFAVGDYKRAANSVNDIETTPPNRVHSEMAKLLRSYEAKRSPTFDDILELHVRFEEIHPFQDGNGRVGRLLLLKECLKHQMTPFIITEQLKRFYYRGLHEWRHIPEYLRDTCRTAQDQFQIILARY